MNNDAVCRIIKEIDDYECIADQCVKDGYGQTCGGYLCSTNTSLVSIKQKEHFLSYYGKKDVKEKNPTYQYLRCPQLLLFIAEISGISELKIKKAYNKLKEYEKNNGLYKTDKSGNYLWGRKDKFLSEFKEELEIYSLVKIIKEANDWEEVKDKIRKI